MLVKVDSDHPEEGVIARAASIIRAGGLVAFPTETVYGLGADCMNERAVERIFEAKGRPSDNPLIVHVDDREKLLRVAVDVSEKAERLIEKFWPGPLTLVLRRGAGVPPSVSAGLSTVAVRMPASRVALALIRQARTPVAAPSANASGRPSPTSASHVQADLGSRIDMILDGGETDIGIESTVLDVTTEPPVILRPGWITAQKLKEAIGAVDSDAARPQLARSPGTRYRHYSPRARVALLEAGSPDLIKETCEKYLEEGPVGFLGHTAFDIPDERFSKIILSDSAGDYARSIYRALRELDQKGPAVIVVEGIGESEEGAAVMDRLRRAASGGE
ncbi:MAG TPA: L-threonylcarbamoyladenylate synthase [Blastocatellia bacterium]|jgi:L-threonylcarbamoyladenylate synthase|nr:L-threonylcarbamoyladenylate synthase [Blastocatellia bacterium]